MAVDLHDVNCPGCGAPMDGHLCPSGGVTAGASSGVTIREYVRGTGPRKTPSAHPDCPHCGGRIHFNMGATAINAECLWRQFLVGSGKLASPHDKLPEMYLSNLLEMAAWYEAGIKISRSFDYGKSGGGTYSTRRKTPVLTPTSVSPAFPSPTAPDPTAGPGPGIVPNPAAPKVKPYVKGKEALANSGLADPAPAKEPTKDELRTKRRELLKARAKK